MGSTKEEDLALEEAYASIQQGIEGFGKHYEMSSLRKFEVDASLVPSLLSRHQEEGKDSCCFRCIDYLSFPSSLSDNCTYR